MNEAYGFNLGLSHRQNLGIVGEGGMKFSMPMGEKSDDFDSQEQDNHIEISDDETFKKHKKHHHKKHNDEEEEEIDIDIKDEDDMDDMEDETDEDEDMEEEDDEDSDDDDEDMEEKDDEDEDMDDDEEEEDEDMGDEDEKKFDTSSFMKYEHKKHKEEDDEEDMDDDEEEEDEEIEEDDEEDMDDDEDEEGDEDMDDEDEDEEDVDKEELEFYMNKKMKSGAKKKGKKKMGSNCAMNKKMKSGSKKKKGKMPAGLKKYLAEKGNKNPVTGKAKKRAKNMGVYETYLPGMRKPRSFLSKIADDYLNVQPGERYSSGISEDALIPPEQEGVPQTSFTSYDQQLNQLQESVDKLISRLSRLENRIR